TDTPRVGKAVARVVAARAGGAAGRGHPRVEEQPLAERGQLLVGPPADLEAACARRKLPNGNAVRTADRVSRGGPVAEQSHPNEEDGAERARRQHATKHIGPSNLYAASAGKLTRPAGLNHIDVWKYSEISAARMCQTGTDGAVIPRPDGPA